MTSIMLSIQPNWCTEIAEGKKTIEVRKTRPNIEIPFKVYIYCTRPYTGSTDDNFYIYQDDTPKKVNGTVIGEFVCDRIDEVIPDYNPITKKFMYGNVYNLESTCLENEQCQEYGKGKPLYGWHITDLKIYDKPKELSEFKKAGFMTEEEWLFNLYPNTHCHYEAWAKRFEINKPPRSWCYVQELTT